MTFLFYDYESYGVDVRHDRPVQFAAIRTDETLVPVSEPLVLHCRPSPDRLIAPEAALIHGYITGKGFPRRTPRSRVRPAHPQRAHPAEHMHAGMERDAVRSRTHAVPILQVAQRPIPVALGFRMQPLGSDRPRARLFRSASRRDQ